MNSYNVTFCVPNVWTTLYKFWSYRLTPLPLLTNRKLNFLNKVWFKQVTKNNPLHEWRTFLTSLNMFILVYVAPRKQFSRRAQIPHLLLYSYCFNTELKYICLTCFLLVYKRQHLEKTLAMLQKPRFHIMLNFF